MMRRLASKKSYSWWWDSHISPKNSKWLSENLEEMDRLVKDMLKLIDEEGDSFAKKAEMYYQKRPELISHVEDFYRMYRALAERYDNVTGELRDSMTSKSHQSRSSRLPSLESTPEEKVPKPKSIHRAAGFEVFLGSGGGSDVSKNESGSSSSSSDSESESDDINGEDGMDADERIMDLENELMELKQKLVRYENGTMNGSSVEVENENQEGLQSKVLDMEKELSDAIERLHVSEEEIMRLTEELEKKSLPLESTGNGINIEKELMAAKDKVQALEEEIVCLKEEQRYEQINVESLESKRILELEEHITSLESQVANHKHELEELTMAHDLALDKCHTDISSHNITIKELKLELQNKEAYIENLKTSIQMFSSEKVALERTFSEREHTIEELKLAVSHSTNKFSEEKTRLEMEISTLSESHMLLKTKVNQLEDDKRQIELEKAQLCAASSYQVEELNKKFNELKHKLEVLKLEKDELNTKVHVLMGDLKSRDNLISKTSGHLQQLHMEHVKLIKEADEAKSVSREMQMLVKELEVEIERQRITIADSAEGKREAIRQLCATLEHYRVGYHELRQALHGHRRPQTVLVT